MKKYKKVLSIAGSDSGGGAGIQADIKTISSIGCFSSSVITCLTAQNTLGVQAINSVEAHFVEQQIISVLSDIGADCIKIGMLHNKEIIQSVSKVLDRFSHIPIVLDPVIISTSKDQLLEESAISFLRKKLFHKATLITPNKYEAEVLINQQISTLEEMKLACIKINSSTKTGILLKGGDFEGSYASDLYYDPIGKSFHLFKSARIHTKNIHGTGCSYSSAVASYIAQGYNLYDSIQMAKSYIHQAIISGSQFKIGKGAGPINHFWKQC